MTFDERRTLPGKQDLERLRPATGLRSTPTLPGKQDLGRLRAATGLRSTPTLPSKQDLGRLRAATGLRAGRRDSCGLLGGSFDRQEGVLGLRG